MHSAIKVTEDFYFFIFINHRLSLVLPDVGVEIHSVHELFAAESASRILIHFTSLRRPEWIRGTLGRRCLRESPGGVNDKLEKRIGVSWNISNVYVQGRKLKTWTTRTELPEESGWHSKVNCWQKIALISLKSESEMSNPHDYFLLVKLVGGRLSYNSQGHRFDGIKTTHRVALRIVQLWHHVAWKSSRTH